MADKASLVVQILGDSKGFDSAIDKVTGKVGKFGSAVSGIVAGAALGAFLKDCTDKALEAERSWAILEVAVNNTGVQFDNVKPAIDANLASLSNLSAFSKGELRGALTTLTQMTSDAGKAQNLLGLAADVARAKNMGVGDAAQKIGLILAGNTRVLKQFGIATREGATAMDYLHELQLKTQGSAEAFGNTYAGKVAKMQNSINALKVAIGEELLPMLGKMSDGVTNSVGSFNSLDASWRRGIISVGTYGTAILMLGKAVVSLVGWIPAAIGASGAFQLTLTRGVLALQEWELRTMRLGPALDGYNAALLRNVPILRGWYDLTHGAGSASKLLGESVGTLPPKMKKLQDETKLTAQATLQAKDAQVQLTRALNGTMVESDTVAAKQRVLREAQLNNAQSAMDLKQAQQELKDAINEHGRNSDEAKQADLRLQQAQLRAADASADLKTAQTECADAIAAAKNPILGTAAAIALIKQNANNAAAALRAMAKEGKLSAQAANQASHGGALFAVGGVARGPRGGYPATLHGTEVVVPIDDRAAGLRWLAEAGRMLGVQGGNSSQPSIAAAVGGRPNVTITGNTFTFPGVSRADEFVDELTRMGVAVSIGG